MTPRQRRPSRAALRADCAETHPDDGADPRIFFRNRGEPSRAPRPNRKTQQLCRQVARALQYVFSGDAGDEVLADLEVLSVAPAPDASQLLVTVAPVAEALPREASEVARRLAAAAGRLRGEAAAAVTRRKAPRLLFQLALPQGEQEARP